VQTSTPIGVTVAEIAVDQCHVTIADISVTEHKDTQKQRKKERITAD